MPNGGGQIDLQEIIQGRRRLTQNDLVFIVAHTLSHLRTPMVGLLGYLSMLADGEYGTLTPKQQALITELEQSVKRMSKTVNDLKKLVQTQKSDETPAEATKGGKKYKVLIFEDERMLRSMYEKKFYLEGFAVAGYDNPTEDPVSIILKEKPDVIISGVIMPVQNGFDAARKYKTDPRTKNIPLIFLTNLAMEKDINNGKELGAIYYMVKAQCMPIDVVNRVREVLHLPIPYEKPAPHTNVAWHGPSVQQSLGREQKKRSWWQKLFKG